VLDGYLVYTFIPVIGLLALASGKANFGVVFAPFLLQMLYCFELDGIASLWEKGI
jgi:hypothetical protein